jgi:hypothetical protein
MYSVSVPSTHLQQRCSQAPVQPDSTLICNDALQRGQYAVVVAALRLHCQPRTHQVQRVRLQDMNNTAYC